MKVIGITGGIGAGKSKVLDYLKEKHNAKIYQADMIAHQLQLPGTEGYQKIIDYFGTCVLAKDKTIDRNILGAIVFENPQKLQALNIIIHPLVKANIKEIIKQESEKHTALVVVEAALLLEDNYEQLCDEIWCVYANENIRKLRLKETRGYDDEKIARIMQSQLPAEALLRKCKVVIDNSNDFSYTCEQIENALR